VLLKSILAPIVVGNVILANWKQLLKQFDIFVKPGIDDGNTTLPKEAQFWNVDCNVVVLKLIGNDEKLLRLEQFMKVWNIGIVAPTAIDGGNLTSSNVEQALKHCVIVIVVAAEVQLFISTLNNERQLAKVFEKVVAALVVGNCIEPKAKQEEKALVQSVALFIVGGKTTLFREEQVAAKAAQLVTFIISCGSMISSKLIHC
jgi:hypothetical protein